MGSHVILSTQNPPLKIVFVSSRVILSTQNPPDKSPRLIQSPPEEEEEEEEDEEEEEKEGEEVRCGIARGPGCCVSATLRSRRCPEGATEGREACRKTTPRARCGGPKHNVK